VGASVVLNLLVAGNFCVTALSVFVGRYH
jgi:hypothetical protein